MRYVSVEDILLIHDRLITTIGGSFGVRDEHLLKSIAERPKTAFAGADMFPSLFDKAAVYLESLATYHVFVDGNKRTGIAVTSYFLFLNSWSLDLPVEEIEGFILQVAQKKKTLPDIAVWLKKHSRKP